MQMEDMVKVVEAAAESVSCSLRRYWPSNGRCEVAERNQTAHLSGAFLGRGWHLWAEAHTDERTDRRHDLVAWHDESHTLCVIEAKRLYRPEGVRSLAADVERIHSFVAIPHEGALRLEPAQCFGLVTATTWEPDIARWWEAKPGERDPWRAGTAAWPDARNRAIRAANQGTWKALPLGTDDLARHHLLYGIWSVPQARSTAAVGPAGSLQT